MEFWSTLRGSNSSFGLFRFTRSPTRKKLHTNPTMTNRWSMLAVTMSGGIQLTSSKMLASMRPPSRCMQTPPLLVHWDSHTAASNYLQGLVLADLDPATAKLAIGVAGPFLSAFGFLFILRIVMSWYPKLPVGKFPFVIAYAPTEPLLSITRKLIPPLGGVDITPVVWFGLISFLNEILVGPQGLLVLLSQQV